MQRHDEKEAKRFHFIIEQIKGEQLAIGVLIQGHWVSYVSSSKNL